MTTQRDAVEQALSTVKRNDDGSVDEKRLVDEVAKLLEFDPEVELLAKAKRAIDRQTRPGAVEAVGQLQFSGTEAYAYEPNRLIADDSQRLIEQDKARPIYKHAEAGRARKNAQRVTAWADRKQIEDTQYSQWAIEQLEVGRKGADITFGVFVRETGLWLDALAEPEDGAIEE